MVWFWFAGKLSLLRPNLTLSRPPSPTFRAHLDPSIRDYEDLQERVEAFIQLHEEAYRRQEEKEGDQLIEAELDQDKIDSFKNAFLDRWEDNNLDRLLEPFIVVEKSLIGEGEPSKNSESFHLDRRMDKKAFTDRLPEVAVSFPEDAATEMGEQNGRGLGQAERYRLFQALQEALPTVTIAAERVPDRLEGLLEESDFKADLLLIGTRMTAINLRESEKFVPAWKEEHPHSDLPGYEGRFGNVPVCSVPADSETIVAVDVTDGLSVRRLRQEETEPLQLSIDEITEEKAQELLNDQPSLGEDFNSEAEAIRHLQQRVLVRGSEHFDFEFQDDAGIVIEIEEGTGE